MDKSIKKFVYLICGFLLLRGFKSFWRAKSADKRAAGAKVGGGRASIPSTCTLYLYLWTCNTNTILVFIRLSTCQLRELCSNSFFYEYIQKGVWVMYFYKVCIFISDVFIFVLYEWRVHQRGEPSKWETCRNLLQGAEEEVVHMHNVHMHMEW